MKLFKKIGAYTQASYNELTHKVSWPSRSELANSAVVVLVASLILALFIYLFDTIFEEVMKGIYWLVR